MLLHLLIMRGYWKSYMKPVSFIVKLRFYWVVKITVKNLDFRSNLKENKFWLRNFTQLKSLKFITRFMPLEASTKPKGDPSACSPSLEPFQCKESNKINVCNTYCKIHCKIQFLCLINSLKLIKVHLLKLT